MLRGPHASTRSAERKIFNDIKSPPFVLSFVEGLRVVFSILLIMLCVRSITIHEHVHDTPNATRIFP